ncbi:hypothetical protein [Aureimonas ureilytica]|uniref:hypothetical protein n=1 Tax=Aureimonas ureilytica TaxID=401562 RepID=UPI0012DE4606|nr:hypothetical protein [Aureimonas ureilytica]
MQELFRIGIAGLRGGSFHSRLSFHRRKQNPENWTTQNRPWKALWTLEVVNGNAQSIQMVEHLLYSVFSRDHQFVDGSGFKASPDQAATFVNMLIAREDDIAKVVEIQLGQLVKVHRL